MTKRAPWGFEAARKKAESYASDKERVSRLLGDAMNKARKHRARLESLWEGLTTLIRLVGAWVRGQYTAVPWRTIVVALAAILYFLNPFDIIPDAIPFAGYVDDAWILAFVLGSIRKDLENFLSWERSRTGPETA
jgi:uncharacterized membrane protein YkvA (DUF1232 family)